MSEPTLFDQTEPTVLAELERVVTSMIGVNDPPLYKHALRRVLIEINRLKPAEINRLKQAYSEGYVQTESAQDWVKKFRQGGC